MNLGETKDAYRKAIKQCRRDMADGALASDESVRAAFRQLEAVRKSGLNAIARYTVRRSLSGNARRGLVTKLDRLHREAQTALRSVVNDAAARRSADPRQ